MNLCSSKTMNNTKNNRSIITSPPAGHQDTMTHLDIFKKFKRFNPLEPSLGFLGFFLVALFFVGFGCFFILDYRAVPLGLRSNDFSWFSSSSPPVSGTGNGRPGFLDEDGGGCDIFHGNWVWDDRYPLYQSEDCSFIDDGFRCLENGRPDTFYTKWRWQPHHCNLPSFDARMLLEKLRNQRLVFVGDSIGRNQWESLLCMLSSAVSDKSSIYEVNGNPITKHRGFLVFMFKDYNCTVEYYRAPFLVHQGRPPAKAPNAVKLTLRVDTLDWNSPQWKDADVLVFNSGHWWNYEKTIKSGCYFQEGEKVKMEMSVETAYKRSIETLIDWMHRNLNMSKTRVFFRTYAPVHFRGGTWNTGGGCHLEKLPDLGSMSDSLDYYFKIILDVMSERSKVMKLEFLNVTSMSARRKDGHASVYYKWEGVSPAPFNHQDCSHWCLPGVPDSWNELLYALLLKQKSVSVQNSSESQAPS